MSSQSSARPFRALLIQLPFVDPALRAARANVPLAAGYLAAFGRERLGPDAVIDILPQALASGGGDAAVLDYAVRGDYDLIGFTAYLWNLERSLALAQKIKSRGVCLTALGGPEIMPGRKLLERAAVDVFASGEGEAVIETLIRSLMKGVRPPRFLQAPAGFDLAGLPNPYLAGALGAVAGGTLHFETMRGCARRCRYCYYAKSSPTLRYFPERATQDFFSFAAKNGAGEIYLMDPSFEQRPRLNRFLEQLAGWNATGIPLHTEMCLESVTPERAALLKRAGFVSVEAGLQSTNPPALAAVKRTWNRERFRRGAASLRAQGIAIRTGVILGLPRDTLADFERTLDFVKAEGLEEGLEIYPLSLLPGSDLAERRESFGIEAMGLPPYWVLGTDALGFGDLFRAEEMIRAKLDRSLFESPLPRFQNESNDFITFWKLDDDGPGVDEFLRAPERIGNSLTLLLPDELFRHAGTMARLADWLRAHNPHTLLQIVVRAERFISDVEARAASDLFFSPGAFLDRCHVFDDDAQGRFAVRLFALTASAGRCREYATAGSFIDPILLYGPCLSAGEAEFLSANRPLLLIPGSISTDELKELETIYSDTPECLLRHGV